jgi:APA family basic amino acid/polyamine antiporter
VICTSVYILVAIAAVGALPDGLAGQDAPLAITSVVLTIFYGQTRVAFAMSRDGLMPERLANVWERTRTPVLLTAVLQFRLRSSPPLCHSRRSRSSSTFGTLFAFLIVNIAVIWLRRSKPDMERGFRVPFVPVIPLIGAALCVYLMTKLPLETWLRFIAWLALGVLIYAVYGYRHSQLRREA